jgi:hypothetical protein
MAIFGERVLATLADGSRCEEFRSAEPSRHVVIDGLFDDAALREVVRDFPAPTRLFGCGATRRAPRLSSPRAAPSASPKAPWA